MDNTRKSRLKRWWGYQKYLVAYIGAAFAIVAVILGGISGLVYLDGSYECDAKASDFEHRYGFWSGCMIQVDDTWIPLDNYRVTDE